MKTRLGSDSSMGRQAIIDPEAGAANKCLRCRSQPMRECSARPLGSHPKELSCTSSRLIECALAARLFESSRSFLERCCIHVQSARLGGAGVGKEGAYRGPASEPVRQPRNLAPA